VAKRISLLVLVLGPARQAQPRNEVQIGRLTYAGAIKEVRNIYIAEGAHWRRIPTEFVFAGHAIAGPGGGSYLILRLGASRIETANDRVGMLADEMRETVLRIKHVVSNGEMVISHGASPS
jgi:hypothetical protein